MKPRITYHPQRDTLTLQHLPPVADRLPLPAQHHRARPDFLPEELPLDEVLALLRSGYGVNAPSSSARVARAELHWAHVDVYAALPHGTYRYDPASQRLALVTAEDLRGCIGARPFAEPAPLNLLYVVDVGRHPNGREEERGFLLGGDAAGILENVALHCARHGLASAVCMPPQQRLGELGRALRLKPTHSIAVGQAIGRPRPHSH